MWSVSFLDSSSFAFWASAHALALTSEPEERFCMN
jgi:hypothetical protein